MKFTPGILDVETLEAGLFDGKFKAKGKIDIKPDGQNYYEANITVNRMSLEKIRSYMEIGDRTITGKLSLTGDISATASNADEFKRTLAGTFQVRAEKGVLKKFSALSKIFSILNVLQLAKLKLPDMTTEGMAYNTITFNASIKDGVLTTKDFFLDSDSLQISASGNVDILKKTIDCVAGIHPLQSIDLIASKIPIAGGFITDARGKLITVRFKIDGPWDNPNVNRK